MTMAETFHIRPPHPDPPFQEPMEQELGHQTAEQMAEQAEIMIQTLNAEQHTAYNAIINSVLNNEGKAFFIDGPGGTGKSFLYKCITKKLLSLGHYISACASTGIAATLIDGCTVHKLFGVPMDLEYDSTSMLHTDSKAAGVIRDSACIIWDEAPSSH